MENEYGTARETDSYAVTAYFTKSTLKYVEWIVPDKKYRPSEIIKKSTLSPLDEPFAPPKFIYRPYNNSFLLTATGNKIIRLRLTNLKNKIYNVENFHYLRIDINNEVQ